MQVHLLGLQKQHTFPLQTSEWIRHVERFRSDVLFLLLSASEDGGPDVDGAAALDVSEGGAVEVHQQSLPPGLVGQEGEPHTKSAARLEIWNPGGQQRVGISLGVHLLLTELIYVKTPQTFEAPLKRNIKASPFSSKLLPNVDDFRFIILFVCPLTWNCCSP